MTANNLIPAEALGNIRALAADAAGLRERAGLWRVSSPDEYRDAGEELRNIKGARTRLDELRKSITAPLDAAKRAAMDLFREPTGWLEQAEAQVRKAMLTFREEREREERRLREEAEARAAETRASLEASAARAASQGRLDDAAELDAAAGEVRAVGVSRPQPEMQGVYARKSWDCEIVDPAALPREYLIPDLPRIRAVVKASKGLVQIPGVRTFERETLAVKGA